MDHPASSSGSSANDRFACVLEEVELRFRKLETEFEGQKFAASFYGEPPDQGMINTLRDQIQVFQVEFRLVTMFHNMVDKLSSGVWGELMSPVFEIEASPFFKVEAAIDEIVKELISARKINKVSRLVLVFTNLLKKMELLNPFIEECCDYLQKKHFLEVEYKHDCWNEFDQWLGLLNSIRENLQILSEKADLPLKGELKAFLEKLSALIDLFVTLSRARTGKLNLRAALRINVGIVAIRAVNLSCLCCLRRRKMDISVAEDMCSAFSYLQHKLDPTATPELLHMILSFLETIRFQCIPGRLSAVEVFISDLLHMGRVADVKWELLCLIQSFIDLRAKDKKIAEQVFPDIAAVVRQVGCPKNSSSEEGGPDLSCFNLVPMMYLLRAELFFIEQMNHSWMKGNFSIFFQDATYLKKSLQDQVEVLHLHMRSLSSKFTGPPDVNLQNWKQLFKQFEEVAKELDSFKNSFNPNILTREEARNVLFRLLLRILVFKAEVYLMDLINSNEVLILPVKDQIGTLKSLVASMSIMPRKLIFRDFEKVTDNETPILMHIESVAREVLSFYYSFNSVKFTGCMMKEMSDLLSSLIEKTKRVIDEIDFKFPHIKFPKINGIGFIDILLIKLEELLKIDSDSIVLLKEHIKEILENLGFLRSFLMEQDFTHSELQNLRTSLVDATYRVEFIIDSTLSGNGSARQNLSWLYHVSENIRHFKEQVAEFQGEAFDVEAKSAMQSLGREISQMSTFEINEDVVVLNDQQQIIIDRLTRGSSQLDIVSIVGMPGIGKTTLANKVYHDPEVVYYFHIRAWCNVSQVYTKRDLLLEVLQHITDLTDNILTITNEDLELVLFRHLKRNRYLIILDDVWSIRPWNDLKISFPDDRNGSRVLITSRLHDMVSKFTLECNLLNLRPLSDVESWELLQRKIYPKEDCPKELLELGKDIARKCEGLPLSVVAIAGLLQGTHKKPESWKQIAESLNSIIVNDPQTRCMDILELSYNHMPDYLKACFLYFGTFQGDKEVGVRRLIMLWVAEGFIQKKESKSLENLAEDYLMDLVGRSLIVVSKRRSNGGVKACRIHDMVRNLCLVKAKKDNFFKLITSNDEPYASFDPSDDFDNFDPSNSMTYKDHRLCISMSRRYFVMSRPSGPYARSLLYFATTDAYPRCPYNVSFISKNFKLLKVLDLEPINMGNSFAAGIDLLVHLHYLAVAGDIDSIPPSLANLRNLEMLLVKGLKGNKVIVPESIWGMISLRQVHVKNIAAFILQGTTFTGTDFHLKNLVSLSMPSLFSGEHAQEIIRRLPNLRELSCIFSKSRGYSPACYLFPRLEDLTQLESLKIVYRGGTIKTGNFNFPSRLKKLTLVNFFLRSGHISTIGRLENLEVLKLLSSTFKDTKWEMTEGEFPQLKFLKFDSLNIVEWNATCEDLPNLRHLVLQKCEYLKKIPIDFVNIPTFQLIEVQGCGDSVEEAIRLLKEEQLEYGIENLKVVINH